jgi:hypothetical protein
MTDLRLAFLEDNPKEAVTKAIVQDGWIRSNLAQLRVPVWVQNVVRRPYGY